MEITQLTGARPLISHIPSKATTFEDYHTCISISFFGSVRKVSKWAYQKSIVSNIYHRIQLLFKLSDKKITTFVSSWYSLIRYKIVLCNQQTSEILVYYWYFLWIQDRSSAHPMKLAASNIEIKLTKAPVEFFYYVHPYKTDSCLNSLLPVGTPSLKTPWYNWSFLFVVLHKPTLLPSTFNIIIPKSISTESIILPKNCRNWPKYVHYLVFHQFSDCQVVIVNTF